MLDGVADRLLRDSIEVCGRGAVGDHDRILGDESAVDAGQERELGRQPFEGAEESVLVHLHRQQALGEGTHLRPRLVDGRDHLGRLCGPLRSLRLETLAKTRRQHA